MTRRLDDDKKQNLQIVGFGPSGEAFSAAIAFASSAPAGSAPLKPAGMETQEFQAAGGNVTVEALADVTQRVLKALRGASAGNVPLSEVARRVREENRLLGRPLPKRAVGSTLLLKGLEAEVAVVLNTEGMSAQHLYVAMTRGSMKLVVCSASPILG